MGRGGEARREAPLSPDRPPFSLSPPGSLVSGDAEGRLGALFGRVEAAQRKSGAFDVRSGGREAAQEPPPPGASPPPPAP